MGSDYESELVRYLRDAHAMEQQSLKTVQAAQKVAGDPQLEALYKGHVRETQEHLSALEGRLEAHGESPSVTKDLSGKVIALTLGGALVSQGDTPAKLAAVAYAFENFEIASYELLKLVAQRAGDEETVKEVDTILVTERQAVEKIGASFELALERSLTGTVSG